MKENKHFTILAILMLCAFFSMGSGSGNPGGGCSDPTTAAGDLSTDNITSRILDDGRRQLVMDVTCIAEKTNREACENKDVCVEAVWLQNEKEIHKQTNLCKKLGETKLITITNDRFISTITFYITATTSDITRDATAARISIKQQTNDDELFINDESSYLEFSTQPEN